MPIPRLQRSYTQPRWTKPIQSTRRANLGPSLDNLDDYCLSKVIGHVLADECYSFGDSLKAERNLSLVSRRWYFLTQMQVGINGGHKINLDKISRRMNGARNMDLFRAIRLKLLKYRHFHFIGTLLCDEFRYLVAALDAARIEQLSLKIKVERDGMKAWEFGILPRYLTYLKNLTVSWTNDSDNDYTNGLIWTIFLRSVNLKTLKIQLNDTISDTGDKFSRGDSISKLSSMFLGQSHMNTHRHLSTLIFNRSSNEPPVNCSYSSLIKSVLTIDSRITRLETNDNSVIKHLIASTDRVCTTMNLKSLKFTTPLKDIHLLSQIISSRSLGSSYLYFTIDELEQIEEVRQCMDNFRSTRGEYAVCEILLHLKDQKYPDCEDKIKSLVNLSRLADMIIYVNTHQRITIDCCHLMWSIGRALQSSDKPGKCLFRVAQQSSFVKGGISNQSEITIPFGDYNYYKINQNTEDLTRHREIIRSIKKNCYNQFVKSVRST